MKNLARGTISEDTDWIDALIRISDASASWKISSLAFYSEAFRLAPSADKTERTAAQGKG